MDLCTAPRDRVELARDELMKMVAEDELRDAVVLAFANKVALSSFLLEYISVLTSVLAHSDGPPEFHDEL